MFGLEGSGFIVALGVTLLLSGAIVYYCNSRIAALEKALVQQNQVLSDFIVNMRTSLENQASMPAVMHNAQSNEHATETAIDAAKAYYSDTVPEDKIEVSEDSDDEEEDSDDEDDLESGSDLESEQEDGEETGRGGDAVGQLEGTAP